MIRSVVKMFSRLMTSSLAPARSLSLGPGDHDRQEPALCVDSDVPAPPVDLLPAMEPAAGLADSVGGLDDLRIDNRGRRISGPALAGAQPAGAAGAPGPRAARAFHRSKNAYTAARAGVGRQRPPLDPVLDDVEDCVEHRP